jgi:hypothetical protein
VNDLPISDERIEELAAALSAEARDLLDRIVANEKLDPELRQRPEEFVEDFETLGADDRQQLNVIFGEIQEASARRIEHYDYLEDLGQRGARDVERAGEFDPSLPDDPSFGEAAAVIKAHGETPLVSEEEMWTVIEVGPSEEEIDAMDWISIPRSEMDVDENGIPTRKAAQFGFGLKDPETHELMKLYPLQVEAMRALASKLPYREFIEGYLDEIPNLKREYLKLWDEGRDVMEIAGIDREEFAREMTSKNLREAYLLSLVGMVRDYPRAPQGIIDFYRGRETRAARRYKKWTEEKTMALIKQVEEEMIEEGIYEMFIGEDGVEYIRPGPNYEGRLKDE